MERSFAIIILAVTHTVIFLLLIAILLSDRLRRSSFRHRRLSRQTSRIEQLLISEAIASCVLQKNLLSLVRALGMCAAELNGYSEWIVFLFENDKEFAPTVSDGESLSSLIDRLRKSGEERFFKWVRTNSSPMFLTKNMDAMAESPAIQKLLRVIAPGLLVPFLDGEKLLGLIILGGPRRSREHRSMQFLTLFGAIAAILIRKVILDEEERRLLEHQQRAENLAAMGKVAAGVAHEIRNPLTFIRSAAEQLSETGNLGSEDSELAAGMIEEIERINQRIEELRSLTRINTGIFEPTDLTGILLSTIRLVEARAKESGVEVVLSLDLERAQVLGSEDKLRQLFLNLMLNGIEAMPNGGKLEVRADLEDRQATIEIEDSGEGIPQGIDDRIFEPFYTTKEGGTGLGLAICYSVANAHGGKVELRKTGPKGSCFAVSLPTHGNRGLPSEHRTVPESP